jgi:serine/threonine protein kinase
MEEELFYNKYRKEVCIGRGASAEVWRVTDMQTGVTQALKIYDPALAKEEDGLDLMRHEFALMANINHQNLLRPLFFDIWDRTNTPFLVLPYCKNGNLSKKKGAFTDRDTWELLRDVASGLAYLHKQDPPIIHQDIKPENILINDDGSYMLTDFGVSAHAKATMHRTISAKLTDVGTMAYMAPEKFGKDKTLIILSDIWSLGAMAYEMVSGEVPFCIGQMEGGVLQLKGAELPELPETVSPDLREIIYKCLELDPWNRPQAADIEVTARLALGEERVSILPGPLNNMDTLNGQRGSQIGLNTPPTDLEPSKSKKPWGIIGAVAGVLAIAVVAALFFLMKDDEPAPEPERVVPGVMTIDKIKSMLLDSSTAIEGWQLLQESVDQGDAEATYLMSRLRFNHEVNDKTMELRQIQKTLKSKNAPNFSKDNQMALELLERTIDIDPHHYKALYELGRYYLSKAVEENDFDRWIPEADNYFKKALEWADRANDDDYHDLIKDKMKMYEEFINNN